MKNITTTKSKGLKQYKKPVLTKMGSVRKLTLKTGSQFDVLTNTNDFN